MPSFRTLGGLALLAGRLAAGRMRHRRRPRDLAARLAAFPRRLPLGRPVAIHWNEHQVPFLEAADDRDLAVALGAVHGHLRLAQMELMRRVALGRLAELLGPAAIDADHLLRAIGLARAVPAIAAGLPPETRLWLEGFRDGINAGIAQLEELPEEFVLLGARPAPWTLADLLAIGRLAGADLTWRYWLRLLRLLDRPDWVRIWQRLTRDTPIPIPSFAGAGSPAARLLGSLGRGGSNAAAVAARRSATGAALLASDPHLPLVLPALWLIAGLSSPSYRGVGLMIPGIPVLALGRNPWIGWGGTSLQAASSDLFDVSDLPATAIAEREETIAVRWGRPQRIRIRETPYGPIVSDAALLPAPAGRRLALRWVGHGPSDEVTAMLRVMRARGWEEFRRALDGFAVPGQNMVYADAAGRVGEAMAARLPRRPAEQPRDLVADRAAARHWREHVSARDLPSRLDPPDGFVASANNRPRDSNVHVGVFFPSEERIRRLAALLGGPAPVGLADLERLQQDVTMPSAGALRDALLRLAAAAGADPTAPPLRRLRAWDGRHDAESAGALAFELLVYHLLRTRHGPADFAVCLAAWDPLTLLAEDLAAPPDERLLDALRAALRPTGRTMRRYRRWGEMHRLRLSHLLAALPGSGRRYRFADEPVGGGNETLMKTAYGLAGGRHHAFLGANARHISDFADPDRNRFVLLGGQDGWIGSSTFLDQLALWRRGRYVTVPLRPETARLRFRHRMRLRPSLPPRAVHAAE